MPERAHLTSLEALESFRASLIIYLSKARPALEEVSSDVLRTRVWLQNDQRAHCENQVRRHTKELEAARLALSSARLSNLTQSTDLEQMAVRRASRALEEAEAKLRRVKQWSREFDSRIEPLARQLDGLMNILTTDMPRAVAHLAQAIKTLAEYAEIAPDQVPASMGQPSSPTTPNDQAASPPEPGSHTAEAYRPATPRGENT
jgi:chromosome segregation ATPase